MRLIAFAAAIVALSACANIGSPPGGPLRTEPPKIIAVTPESGSVNVRENRVTFSFDAVVSDRPGGQATTLEGLFLISPTDGSPRVSWERDHIEVRPRRGFKANTAYAVTLLPGIADLRGNVARESRTVIFSTGPTIPPHSARGRVFDWMAERLVTNAMVEVVRSADSLRYIGTTDSTGQFDVGPLAPGAYVVRAFVDANRNRDRDPQEPWDSTAVTIGASSPFLELLAAPRDTVAPRLQTVQIEDSLSLVASFDRALDPVITLTPASFRVLAADSTRLVVARVLPRGPRRTQTDTTPARVDSAVAPVQQPTGVQQPAPARPSLPAPVSTVLVQLDASNPLRAGQEYRVVAVNARGLLGAIRTSERVITVPRRDTTRTTPPPR